MKQANGEVKSGDEAAREAQMKKDELKVRLFFIALPFLFFRVWRQAVEEHLTLAQNQRIHPISSTPISSFEFGT